MVTRLFAFVLLCFLSIPCLLFAQSASSRQPDKLFTPDADSLRFYSSVNTYINPVLPGDHPDPTLLKVGDDFYHCGSSFHFNPYLPVYHSRDLVHWKVIGRVLPPSGASMVTDRPSAGVWQGAITYFYGSYWIYFSSNGQWFSRASSPAGPWSAPVLVKTNNKTGPLGYDNSIFVDDDGKPYMVIKNGQRVNRLQALGRDGQLTDTVINLDWINAGLQYSWAEGPVMCKRNGYYYYFPAGDVSGGQYVLRSRSLTADSTQWERLGDFFKPGPDSGNTFQNPNHIAAPVQLADGTWWTLGQSYQKKGFDDWSGMGRQTSLYQVIWEGDRPWGLPPVSTPVPKPALINTNIPWRTVHSDNFDSDSLGAWWHFLNKAAAGNYSLSARKGWMRLTPDSGRTHIVQKETDHFYTVVTRVELPDKTNAALGGIYLSNGNQQVFVRLYIESGKNKNIVLQLDTAIRKVPFNNTANSVWLKLVRHEHHLSGYYSVNGKQWLSTGGPIQAIALDKTQPNWNSWVGTSVGLFAENGAADFDLFVCKDGFSSMPATGSSNHYGIQHIKTGNTWQVTNTSVYGGWLMISGVDFGITGEAQGIEVDATASKGGTLEFIIDDLKTGTTVVIVPVKAGATNHVYPIKQKLSGQHDLFVKYAPGVSYDIFIKSIRLLRSNK